MRGTVRQNEKNMKVRDAKAAHMAALLRLWQRFMMELHAGKAPARDETESWRDRLKLQIGRREVIIAANGLGIRGFAGFIDHTDRAFVPPGVAFLVDLYVAPGFRRQGIAQALLRYVMIRAAGNGHQRMWTNTDEWNEPARRCIEKAGFRVLKGFALPGLTGQNYYEINIKRDRTEPPGAGDA